MKKQPSELWLRLQKALKTVGLTRQTEIAKALKVKQQTVSKWKLGHTLPNLETMLEVARLTGFETHWLYTGKGAERAKAIKPMDAALQDLFDQCTEDERAEALRYLSYIVESHKGK